MNLLEHKLGLDQTCMTNLLKPVINLYCLYLSDKYNIVVLLNSQ